MNCGREEWEHLTEGCGCESWDDCACGESEFAHWIFRGCPPSERYDV